MRDKLALLRAIRRNTQRITSGTSWLEQLHLAAGLLSVPYNDECDVVVALATLGNGDPAVIEPAVINFLNSNPMVLWAKKELGLEFVRREW